MLFCIQIQADGHKRSGLLLPKGPIKPLLQCGSTGALHDVYETDTSAAAV